MNDTDARRRNHWVSHIARHAHEKPGAVYLRFEGGTITWAQIHERVSAVAAALRREYRCRFGPARSAWPKRSATCSARSYSARA